MRKNGIEKYEDIVLALTALTMKANRVTDHHFFMDFSGHIDGVSISYLENGYKEGESNRVVLLNVHCNVDEDILDKLYECKKNILALIEGSEDNGKLSDSM